jgi:hypothetical protein
MRGAIHLSMHQDCMIPLIFLVPTSVFILNTSIDDKWRHGVRAIQ